MDTRVLRHADAEIGPLVAAATRAFWNDPMFNYFQPNLLRQHRTLPGFFAAAIDDCLRHGEVWTAFAGSDPDAQPAPAGVAAWLPPGVGVPTSGRRALRQLRLSAPTMSRTKHRRAGLALLNEMPKHHHHGDHWYLQVLATDPLYQGRGVGTSLLEPVLQRADDAHLPVYLETQKASNLPYYRRFGFEVTEELNISTAPTLWTMTREPR